MNRKDNSAISFQKFLFTSIHSTFCFVEFTFKKQKSLNVFTSGNISLAN